MQAKYDVIVVGAGPAGCIAAKEISSSGLDTLLIERRREIGVPVQCGEYLPTIKEMRTMFPYCPRLQQLGKVPSEFITNQTKQMVLYSPRFKDYRFSLESNIIDRIQYDKYLANEAVKAGTHLALGTRVISKDANNQIQVISHEGKQEIHAKIVVGADGPNSIVARSLGLAYPDRDDQISQAMQYVIGNIDVNLQEPMMFFGHKVAPGGYAWIIPKSSTTANVGFGLRRNYIQAGNSLSSYLQNLIWNKCVLSGKLAKGDILSRVSASIPVGGPLKRTYSANSLLVGDAAGHVMASNGGGIPTALAGGSIAGQVVVSHLEDGFELSNYEKIWKREFGVQLYSALAALRVADVMMRNDSLTEIAMKLTGERYLEDVIKCRVPTPFSFGTFFIAKLMEML